MLFSNCLKFFHFSIYPILFLSLAIAQEPKSLDSCKEQIAIHCAVESQNKNFREILKCLSRHHHELSITCKEEIQRFSKILQQTTPPGAGPLGMLGGMTSLAGQVPMLAYDGSVFPSDGDGPKSPSMSENNLKLSMPVYKSDTDRLSLSLVGGRLHFGQPILLDSGLEVPDDLYRTSLGLQYSRRLPNQKMYGFQATYGYTGDELNKETQTYNLNGNYSFPGSKEGHWVLMLMLSNNSPFGEGIPIPGFFYIYKTDTFTGVFGLPISSVQWTPVSPWSFSLSALGPLIKSEVSYGTIDSTQYFTGASWNQQRFLLSDRESEEDRLTIEDKKLEVGLRKPIFKETFGELRTGYSFDRFVYMGEGLFNRDSGETRLNSSWFLIWSVRILF